MKGSGPGSGAADSALWGLLVTEAQTRAMMRWCDLGSTFILEIWTWLSESRVGIMLPFLVLVPGLGYIAAVRIFSSPF